MKNFNPTPIAIQSAIIVAMNDLLQYSDDTVWITRYETVFERLWELYLIAGGEEEDLTKRFGQLCK